MAVPELSVSAMTMEGKRAPNLVGVLHNGMISSGEVQLSILELFENIVG
jgi:hypothetical protein